MSRGRSVSVSRRKAKQQTTNELNAEEVHTSKAIRELLKLEKAKAERELASYNRITGQQSEQQSKLEAELAETRKDVASMKDILANILQVVKESRT